MKISTNGENFIKKYEGCRLFAYKALETEKYYTIGYGHYGKDVQAGSKITQAEADKLFEDDIQVYVYGVNGMLKHSVNQNQFDALVSFAYNCGVGALSNSDLLKYVNKGDFASAANEFDKWVHSGGQVIQGLVNRRADEKRLFLKAPVKTTKTELENYTIRSGENLTKIAQRRKITLKQLLALNPSIKNPNFVLAGQKIKVPKM